MSEVRGNAGLTILHGVEFGLMVFSVKHRYFPEKYASL